MHWLMWDKTWQGKTCQVFKNWRFSFSARRLVKKNLQKKSKVVRGYNASRKSCLGTGKIAVAK